MAERLEAAAPAAADAYTQDGTVDLHGNPVLRSKRGGWKACGFVVGCSSGIVEQNLLSQFKGDAKVQAMDDQAEPSLALSLRVGCQEETQPQPQPQNRLPPRWSATPQRSPSLLRGSSVPPHQTYATTGQSPGVLRAGSGVPPPQTYAPTRQSPGLLRPGSSVPSPQTYAPGSSPAGAGLAPPQLGSNSLQQLPLGATPCPCGACNLRYDRLAADLLRRVSEDLDRRVGLLRQELCAEVRKEVMRLHAAAAAAAPGIPLPAAAFSAAGLPQPQPQPQPCVGGAWCWGCGARPGTVVVEPYEHLCLCVPCSHDASRVCLHCSFTSTGAGEAASRGRGRRRERGGSLPPWTRP